MKNDVTRLYDYTYAANAKFQSRPWKKINEAFTWLYSLHLQAAPCSA